MEPVVVSGLVLGSVIFCIGLLSAIIRRRRDSKTKHGRQQVSNEKVVIPEERLKELAGPTDFINWSPTKLLHEAHEMAVMIAALQAEVDALKASAHRASVVRDGLWTVIRDNGAEITALKAELALLSAPVTDAARDKEKCSPRCVAYEAGDRFAVSHEDGCPNGGSKLAIKRGNFCTVPDCRFPDRHSTEVHRKHLATEQRLATPPQDVEKS